MSLGGLVIKPIGNVSIFTVACLPGTNVFAELVRMDRIVLTFSFLLVVVLQNNFSDGTIKACWIGFRRMTC